MKKLLVADDSELIRLRLVEMLRGLPGVDAVETAGNLAQTLDQVFECPPDLTVLDLHLPDGNAIQILAALKRIAPAMQIVVLTNDASEFNRRRCMEEGAGAFFDKSKEFEVALSWVQRQAAVATAQPAQPQ